MAKGSRGGRYAKKSNNATTNSNADFGIGKRGKERSADEVRASVNPNFNTIDARANGWRHNCQSCSITQEAMIRGYDVEVFPHAPNTPWFPSADGTEHKWYDAIQGNNKDFYTRDNRYWVGKETSQLLHTERQVQREVTSWGDGARGFLSVRWTGGSSSHIMNIINGGKEGVYISDGQSGMRYRLGDVLRDASNRTGFLLTRVDNLEFTSDVRYLTKRR